MNLKDFFVHLFFQRNEEKCPVSDSSSALICMDPNGKYEYLSEVETLKEVSVLTAKGKWNDNDFIQLRNKFRTGLPASMANVVLREIDLGNVSLDSSCEQINLKELFNFCVNLTTVTLPDATHYEGSVGLHSTFRGCGKLKEIRNLNTYHRISDLRGTFCYCTVLTKLELYSHPFPHGDSETFRNINRSIRIMLPPGTHIPSDWTQLNPENIVFKGR